MSQTVFDGSKVTVLFVLGGPGAGKGTQCAELVKEFRFCHLSAGDLLRAEQDREGSRYGDLIKSYIKDGQIVPMEVTIKLLENAMTDALKAAKKDSDGWSDGHGRFLIDGFPRKMDQAEKFEQEVCPSSLTIFFDTSEEVLLKRLTKRGETSGRADDNPETIKKRFRTYTEQTMPVIDHFKLIDIHKGKSLNDKVSSIAKKVIVEGKVGTIDSTGEIEEVARATQTLVAAVLSTKQF